MKNSILALIFIVSFQGYSQSLCHFASDSVKDVVWYGVDYSTLYLPPSFVFQMDRERIDSTDIQSYFEKMNNEIAKQYRRFDIGGSFKKGTFYDTSAVMDKMRSLEIHENFVKKDSLTLETAQALIDEMELVASEGYGVICFPTTMGIRKNLVTIFWVIFDIETKTIVMMEPITTPKRGELCYELLFEAMYISRRLVQNKYYPTWLLETCNMVPVETRPAPPPRK